MSESVPSSSIFQWPHNDHDYQPNSASAGHCDDQNTSELPPSRGLAECAESCTPNITLIDQLQQSQCYDYGVGVGSASAGRGQNTEVPSSSLGLPGYPEPRTSSVPATTADQLNRSCCDYGVGVGSASSDHAQSTEAPPPSWRLPEYPGPHVYASSAAATTTDQLNQSCYDYGLGVGVGSASAGHAQNTEVPLRLSCGYVEPHASSAATITTDQSDQACHAQNTGMPPSLSWGLPGYYSEVASSAPGTTTDQVNQSCM
ncbi:hypothetical protein PAXRUDRAFT_457926 [Paxillus rubicundulus Ve08.2h10]|uniref:Uncharacterized protein n=1 Tax=Paxillus rubicundulus Ve08.2h10 TaxID=930991 RepID=A0A0D0D702_9AGAM|nr:hypothetical protein PAXRUDRAFT_457926 [Paxillus rubicundulus Ve08.2h10]